MAKLGSYYGLCPLIDNKSLLGISNDSKKGIVIVTLGKNISIKYKLSDQKQKHSWRTKEKFTSPIIYDQKQDKYVTVFNQLYIRLWSGDEENLDKLKKYKFNSPIHTIISQKENSYILFKNGSIYNLHDAIDIRKTLEPESILSETDSIQDILFGSLNEEDFVGIIVKSDDDIFLLWTKCSSKNKFYKIKLAREGCRLIGYTFHMSKTSVNILTMWSDGRMFSCPLEESDIDLETPGELCTVIETISCKEQITMTSLEENYIALYGPKSNEEGAILVIYNTQFKVIQSKQHFKIFTTGAKIWNIENNLLLSVGQNLAVVPYCLETEQLAALVGSHKSFENKLDDEIAIVNELEVVNWNDDKKTIKSPIPEILKDKIEEYLNQGLPENSILETILPKVLEENDIAAIKSCLGYFCDIPEKCLAKMLKCVINADKSLFSEKSFLPNDFPKKLQPFNRTKIINTILSKPFSEVLILPHIRNELSIEDSLLLLEYFCFMLSENGTKFQNLTFTNTYSKIIEWGCILIDSNYQKFLLTRDENITKTITQFRALITEELENIEDIKQTAPLLTELKNGKDINKAYNNSVLRYSIEQLSLY